MPVVKGKRRIPIHGDRLKRARHPIFAATYESLLGGNEKAGLRAIRSELLRWATGKTLEVGAGTGLNLEHYPDAVTDLVLAEPDPHMTKRLRRRLDATPPPTASVELVDAEAEQLPFEDASFDTVVASLLLCSVRDPRRAVDEIRRVLRPDGHFLYIEHVRDEHGTRRARWQERLDRPWASFMGGCHPNRDSGRLISEAFGIVEPIKGEFPGSGTALVKPLIRGMARRPA